MTDEIIAELTARIEDLEDKVNNKLIGGLQKAKDKYDDDLAYEDFKTKYGADISKIDEGMKRASANPDYDTCREFYDAIKTVDGYGSDGFDVANLIAEKIKELAFRYNIPIEVEVKEEAEDAKEGEAKVEDTKEEDKESEVEDDPGWDESKLDEIYNKYVKK